MQKDLGKRLSYLYRVRPSADYHGDEDTEEAVVRAAVRSVAFLIRTLRSLLPGE